MRFRSARRPTTFRIRTPLRSSCASFSKRGFSRNCEPNPPTAFPNLKSSATGTCSRKPCPRAILQLPSAPRSVSPPPAETSHSFQFNEKNAEKKAEKEKAAFSDAALVFYSFDSYCSCGGCGGAPAPGTGGCPGGCRCCSINCRCCISCNISCGLFTPG